MEKETQKITMYLDSLPLIEVVSDEAWKAISLNYFNFVGKGAEWRPLEEITGGPVSNTDLKIAEHFYAKARFTRERNKENSAKAAEKGRKGGTAKAANRNRESEEEKEDSS